MSREQTAARKRGDRYYVISVTGWPTDSAGRSTSQPATSYSILDDAYNSLEVASYYATTGSADAKRKRAALAECARLNELERNGEPEPTEAELLRRRWTREAILDAIHAHHERTGSQPAAHKWPRNTLDTPSARVVIRVFGTWNNAMIEAGFAPGRGGRKPKIAA